MAEDIKSLTKKNSDLEKRLKVVEAKVKALADNMTSSKDIEKYIDVVNKEQTDRSKKHTREMELQRKVAEAYNKEAKKEGEKIVKEHVKYAEMQRLEARLKVLEVQVWR